MLGKIFISYRRGDDPGSAGRLLDVLKATFEADQLFIDVDNIEPGLDFVQVIQERVAQSQILLAVIGKHWCDARGVDGSRRLDDPSDIVRVEIESALDQNKRVIPVLIGDIKMPTPEDLPQSLRPLIRRNAVQIRHERFRDDAARLTEALEQALRAHSNIANRTSPLFGTLLQNPRAVRFAIITLALALAVSTVAVLYFGPMARTALPLQSVADKEVLTAPAQPVQPAQPAWCLDKNLKPDELRVCSTQALWALDNQLNELFQAVLKMTAPDELAALQADKNTWLRERGGCVQDENCLLEKYQERIAYYNKLKNSSRW
jgi:uncharacterized protein YecT (DUF1311 family)